MAGLGLDPIPRYGVYNIPMKQLTAALLALLVFTPISEAHQPVMDMAPRWKGGYGLQIRSEYVKKRRLELDGTEIANPNGLEADSWTTSLEGVYTFTRAYRMTLKIPQIFKSETFLLNGQIKELRAAGLGVRAPALPSTLSPGTAVHSTLLLVASSLKTRSIRLAIVTELLPANRRPTDCSSDSATMRDPESPPALKDAPAMPSMMTWSTNLAWPESYLTITLALTPVISPWVQPVVRPYFCTSTPSRLPHSSEAHSRLDDPGSP